MHPGPFSFGQGDREERVEVKEKIEVLKNLQEIDRRLAHYRRMREYEPRRLAEQQAAVAAAEAKLKSLGEKHIGVHKDISKRELDVKTRQEKINRLKGQMLAATTNKEYQAFLKEVSLEEAERARAEDEILEMMLSTEAFAKEEAAVTGAIGEAKASAERVAGEVKAAVAEAMAQEAKLAEERKAVASALDADTLRKYDSLFRSRNGEAVVAATYEAGSQGEEGRYMCRGCFVPITHQMLNLLMIGKDIITCKSCGRILHMEDHKS